MYTRSVAPVDAGTWAVMAMVTSLPAFTDAHRPGFGDGTRSGFGAGVESVSANLRTASRSPSGGSFAEETSIRVTFPDESNVTRAYLRACGAPPVIVTPGATRKPSPVVKNTKPFS